MPEEDRRIALGRVAGAHGVRGDVLIHSFTADPVGVAAYGALETDGGGSIRLAVRHVTPKGVVAHVAGVDDRNAAEALKGAVLYVSRERLPETVRNEFYHADLVGMRAVRPNGEAFGTVVSVQNFGAGDILEIAVGDGTATELIPFTNAFAPEVDCAARRLTVVLAEGDADGKPEEKPPP